MAERFHIITCGSGLGKITLTEAVGSERLDHIAEAGHAIIQVEVNTGGTAPPWSDRELRNDANRLCRRACYFKKL